MKRTLTLWWYKARTRQDVSIISDDCWGAEFYRTLGIPYRTPTVGLYVEPTQFLSFIANLRKEDAFELEFFATEHAFPVARTPYATLYFMHYSSAEEARETLHRRARRINWDRLLVKVDFGKTYREEDVAGWNALKLPRSVALVPESSRLAGEKIWHGVVTPCWEVNGARMFAISKNFFDFPLWTRTGEVRVSPGNRLLRKIALNPRFPKRLKESLLG